MCHYSFFDIPYTVVTVRSGHLRKQQHMAATDSMLPFGISVVVPTVRGPSIRNPHFGRDSKPNYIASPEIEMSYICNIGISMGTHFGLNFFGRIS